MEGSPECLTAESNPTIIEQNSVWVQASRVSARRHGNRIVWGHIEVARISWTLNLGTINPDGGLFIATPKGFTEEFKLEVVRLVEDVHKSSAASRLAS